MKVTNKMSYKEGEAAKRESEVSKKLVSKSKLALRRCPKFQLQEQRNASRGTTVNESLASPGN